MYVFSPYCFNILSLVLIFVILITVCLYVSLCVNSVWNSELLGLR